MDQTKDGKRSAALRAGAVALLALAVLAGGWAVSNTLAKYAAKLEATSSAPVARFEVGAEFTPAAGGDPVELKKEGTTTVELFKVGVQKNESGADNDAVAEGRIAPGTMGEFEFDVKNGSEVDVECSVTCDLSKVGDVPLVFSMDGGTTWTTVGDATATTATPVDLVKAADPANPTTETLKVMWKWPFERGGTAEEKAAANAADTALGEKVAEGAVEPQVDLDVTFEQKKG